MTDDTAPIAEQKPAPQVTEDNDSPRPSKIAEIIWSVLWLGVVTVVAFKLFFVSSADVVLEIPKDGQTGLRGVVLHDGKPVKNGTVQIVVESSKDTRYFSSAVLNVTNDGTFLSDPHLLPGDTLTSKFRITAKYFGTKTGNDGNAVFPSTITGECTLYTNSTPPVGKQTIVISLAIGSLLVAALIYLFTSSLTQWKARWLFAITYLMTFLSIGVPLVVVIMLSQNHYMVELFESSPVGLIKAKAKGISSPQWLINIGGLVSTEVPAAAPAAPAAAVAATPASPTVEGGLAIPFYVVLLAMFGAGINMTQKVPQIQKEHTNLQPDKGPGFKWVLGLFFKGAADENKTPSQIEAAANIKAQIINNYMYLLSAPFLAIAVYYLLQVVATNVADPILVVMAFSTGLIADQIVDSIMGFAEKILAQAGSKSATPTPAVGQLAPAVAQAPIGPKQPTP